MRINSLLYPKHIQRRQSDGCVSCPATPPCNCAANEDCFQITKTCNSCGSFTCVVQNTNTPQSSGSGGISAGALAGIVISVVLVFAAIGAYLYRRHRAQKPAAIPEIKDVPAPAESVLNRPDPSEKLSSRPPTELVDALTPRSDGVVDHDLESQLTTSARVQDLRESTQSNPFSDGLSSIQTTGSAGTQGTNVIPIGLVPQDSISATSSSSTTSALEVHNLMPPVRPSRSPELDLNADPVSAAREGARATYAQSQVSGVSGVSSRNSYISNMSYSSEFLKEAPVIITPTRGVVRQVIGSVKAEMVSAPGSAGLSTPNTPNSLAPPSIASRPSIRSPLAATSFGPSDILSENEEEHELPVRNDPFGDEHSPNINWPTPSAHSVTTFGNSSPGFASSATDLTRHSDLLEPNQPWAQSSDTSRPSSVSTQASIIADISSATRVNVGLSGLQSGNSNPGTPPTDAQFLRTPYRTTMGRLVTPASAENLGTLEQQQQRALAHAQARAQAQGGEKNRRVSGSSAISNTADSILESFPFVPPSPISDRPVRSPPRSPNQPDVTSKFSTQPPQRPPPPSEPLIPPSSRRTLGLSSASQLSTASTGLGSFPFQIDSDPTSGDDRRAAPPTTFQGRQRASLDTLALTSDLSSYPLGYDCAEQRDSFDPRS
jgi:hypothetical protein